MEANIITIQAEYIAKLRVIDQRQHSAANSAARTKASNKLKRQLADLGCSFAEINNALNDARDMFMLEQYPGVVDQLNNSD